MLAEVSGSEVSVVPIGPLDWVLGRVRGYGQLVFEVASTVDAATRDTAASPTSLL
jgi:hypothetical protein